MGGFEMVRLQSDQIPIWQTVTEDFSASNLKEH